MLDKGALCAGSKLLVLATVATLATLATLASACVDVRAFEGQWTGSIVEEPAVRQGFTTDVRAAPLVLSKVALQGISAVLTTTDGKFKDTPLTRITKTASDALASLSFDGDPLRTYLLFAHPISTDAPHPAIDEGPALAFISLFGDNHVELRLVRGNDLFGVFYLRRDE